MIEYSGKLSIEAATALAQANYNHKTQEEIITLKQRIAELDAAGKDMALALTQEPYEDKQCMACGADDTEWNGEFMAFVHEDGCPTLVFQQPDSGVCE
jgi:hypothetical protein